MKPFLYCPACASGLDDPGDDGGRGCPGCGRSWYRNPAPTAGAAIVRDGRVLITVRARDPLKGKFDVPGGFLGPTEDPVTAVKREIREELGVEIAVEDHDYIQAVPHDYGEDRVLAMGFSARLVSGEPRPADDVAEARWVTAEELEELDFAWEHDRELARRALRGRDTD
jgi:ADP-ribose pyrophosphatase YjhB (NUDIX family)